MKQNIFLFAMMLLPMVAGAETVEIDGIYYELITKAKQAEVTKSPKWNYKGSVVIPASITYNGVEYSVTSIGDYAFSDCSGLTSVTIPNSVTSIGLGAFYDCSRLTSVTIPNSVTSIEGYTFFQCVSLTSVTIGNSVTSIGDYAFFYCRGLTSVTIPNSVTSIGVEAFDGCSGLTSVTIGNSVMSIGDDAFNGCSGLTSVTIPNSVTSIGSGAFLYCSSLTSVKVENGNKVYDSRNDCNAIIKTENNELLFGCKNTVIPNSVTSIGAFAFYECSGLTSVMIPNSVTSIERYAFFGCSGLTSTTIGSGVKNIGSQAFASCKELTDVYCLAEEVPSTNTYAFLDSYINYVTLHVPFASIDAYRAVEPWKNFKEIKSLTGEVIPETPKCDKPSIIKEGNKFWFECGTPGATIKGKLTPNVEELEFEGSEMVFTGSDITYTLTVVASAEGYEDSDPVKMTLTIDNCDTNKDGVVDVADIATIISKMASQARIQEETAE